MLKAYKKKIDALLKKYGTVSTALLQRNFGMDYATAYKLHGDYIKSKKWPTYKNEN